MKHPQPARHRRCVVSPVDRLLRANGGNHRLRIGLAEGQMPAAVPRHTPHRTRKPSDMGHLRHGHTLPARSRQAAGGQPARQRDHPLPPMIGGMIDGKGGISGSSSGAAGFSGVMVRAMMTFCLILRPRCHGISAKILAEASNSTRAARISKITTVIRAARRVSVATGLPCGKRPLAAASGSGSNRTGGRSSP